VKDTSKNNLVKPEDREDQGPIRDAMEYLVELYMKEKDLSPPLQQEIRIPDASETINDEDEPTFEFVTEEDLPPKKKTPVYPFYTLVLKNSVNDETLDKIFYFIDKWSKHFEKQKNEFVEIAAYDFAAIRDLIRILYEKQQDAVTERIHPELSRILKQDRFYMQLDDLNKLSLDGFWGYLGGSRFDAEKGKGGIPSEAPIKKMAVLLNRYCIDIKNFFNGPGYSAFEQVSRTKREILICTEHEKQTSLSLHKGKNVDMKAFNPTDYMFRCVITI
jgi:hypothetical protein